MDDNQEIEVYEETRYNPLPFCVDALRTVSVKYIIWLVFALALSLAIYFLYAGAPLSSIRPSVFVYYLIVVIHVVYRIGNGRTYNVLAPDILFIFVYTLFHLGYVTLYALKLVPYFTEVFVFESSIPKALFIINLGLVSFLFGYEFLGTRRSRIEEPGVPVIPGESWCILGLALIIIAFATHAGVIFFMGLAFFRQHGYKAFQDIEKISGSYFLAIVWRHALKLMILGLVIHCMSSALRHGKLFKSNVALGITIAFFTFVILEGDRGPLAQMGIPLLLIRHFFVKRIRISTIAGLTLASFALFAAMGIVRIIVFKPTKMIEEYKYQRQVGVVTWMSPFIEMGGSFLVVNITSHEVPSQEPYWLGDSWREAAIHIVPFLSGYFARKGWSTWPPSTWLKVTYYGPERAGRAFTVSAEGYLNFGYLGVFVELMLFGVFIRWLTKKFSRRPSAMWGVIMLGCFGTAIMVIRNHVGIVLNVFAQVMVLVWLMNMFLGDEPEYVYELESGQMEPSDFEAQHY